MPRIFDKLDPKKERDIVVLANFVQIFCRQNHRDVANEAFIIKDERLTEILGEKKIKLCDDCSRLLSHGIAKLMLCPYDPKPSCKKCETHCYAPGYREKVREVMRFSGMYSIKHGRVDLIKRYWF
jgi:hypothetical protein